MDSVEIFFILIAIYGLISAVIKKLKKKGAAAQRQTKSPTASPDQRKKAPEDLLEEFFGIKIPKEGDTPARQKASVESVHNVPNSSTWNPEDDFADVSDEKPYKEKVKPAYVQKETKVPIERPKHKSIPAEKQIKKRKSYSRGRLIKSKIKNPKLIKDYILVSEILNKPVALRK
jgi:hypothetical protein